MGIAAPVAAVPRAIKQPRVSVKSNGIGCIRSGVGVPVACLNAPCGEIGLWRICAVRVILWSRCDDKVRV